MSYPPARYHGETGEASARVRGAGADADLVLPSGVRVHYLATGGTSDGLFGLYRWEMPGDTSGADPHFHRTFAESFYVLTGEVEFNRGDGWGAAGAGTFVHVPPGGIHGFRNTSGAAASMLIHFAPAGPRERYFEQLWRLGQLTPEDRAAFFAAHDQVNL